MTARKATEAILADLTEPQREAVCHGDGPLLVVAGAGSGKTRVITRRIAHLLSQGVKPERIIAVTFTNKAAGEMQRRVEAMTGRAVLISTFHSFCSRLLRREIRQIGGDPSFSIYDRTDSLSLVRKAIKDGMLDSSVYAPRKMLGRISSLKADAIWPEEWRKMALGIEDRALAEVYAAYQQRLEANNALDFDDLLLKTILLFQRCPHVLQEYQDRFQHVLIDEYQDTNLPQHLIARALQGKHRNIVAVGDPDQMIYSWRGARLNNILEFEHDFPGCRVIMLERNYRSTANILHAASVCIGHNELRHEKVLWTDSAPGEPVRVLEFEDSYEEAEFVADKTVELTARGTAPGQIAVFYRTRHQSLPLEHAFSTRALPHQVVDSVGFFDRKEVKDLRAYMQILVNPDDDEACLRIINVPHRGIGQKTQQKLLLEASARKLSVLRMAHAAAGLDSLGKAAQKAVAQFCKLYDEITSLDCDRVTTFIEELVERTEYLDKLGPEEKEDASEVINHFLGYADQYDKGSPGGDLRGFLEQAALVSDVDGWNSSAPAVPFMTLHSAKGLEFDVVFITGLEDELLPHRRSTEEHGSRSQQAAIEEERRLLHVGMTRARKELYLTCCRSRFWQGREQAVLPSRFLEELPSDGVERHVGRFAKPLERAASDFAEDMRLVLRAKRAVAASGAGPLAPGQRVSHAMFGEGEVMEVTPSGKFQKLKVKFDTRGEMTLLVPREEPD